MLSDYLENEQDFLLKVLGAEEVKVSSKSFIISSVSK